MRPGLRGLAGARERASRAKRPLGGAAGRVSRVGQLPSLSLPLIRPNAKRRPSGARGGGLAARARSLDAWNNVCNAFISTALPPAARNDGAQSAATPGSYDPARRADEE
eukprot:7042042-Pyramimonas_sp.AAC.1